MKTTLFCLCLISSLGAIAQSEFGYLKKTDQQFYKNDSMDGNNQRERVDSAVKEINKVHGEIASLKAEIEKLKQEVAELKANR